ncbi:MAG: class I tRNA ligase family protein, partial [Bacteroidota bacterium]
DENDKNLGDKHNLEVIDIFHEDASLNSYGLHYEGKDRFVVRKEIAKELEETGFLVKTEQHTNKVGTSERTKAVIEPRLSDQWFLKMEGLAKPALEAVMNSGEVKLHPKKFENTYRHWMENIRDWNISRQLWWGQQIPAYYFGDGKEDFVVAESRDLAFDKAKALKPGLKEEELRQDPDVVDTWFSAWLWPISVFGGILEPDNPEVNYYYPTSDLITGPDILFFWVARMIVSGYEFRGERPFENVYLTGLVRDKQRRKMSKSLGNSPDALKLIDDFGADGVRVGLLLSSPAGNDLLFDEALCQQGKNFANKIWNAFRLVMGWEVVDLTQPNAAQIGLEWYEAKFNQTLVEVNDHFSKYRISDALMAIYKLVWDDFCSWLLEIAKPAYQHPVDQTTRAKVMYWFEQNLKLLHPFMPFLTEEVWQHISKRTPEQALVISEWPETQSANLELIKEFDFASDVISGIRTIRKEKNIAQKESLDCFIQNNEGVSNRMDAIITKLGNINAFETIEDTMEGALSFRVKSNEYFIPMGGAIDIEAEIKKITEELNYTKGFLQSVQKKLGNERFVNN